MNESINSKDKNNAEALAQQQRSHTLLVFCKAEDGKKETFFNWFKTDCLRSVAGLSKVLSVDIIKNIPLILAVIIRRSASIIWGYTSSIWMAQRTQVN